ncbi:unnamed protein product, partial [Litomosoides sigmodontis]
MEDVKQTSRNDDLYATNVKIYVESTTCTYDVRNLIEQSCPALIIRSQEAIPKVVKHIYSHLAAHSSHSDESFPDIIISLISGRNTIDLQKQKQIEKALLQIISHCNSWLVVSGEACDPLAFAASKMIHAKESL